MNVLRVRDLPGRMDDTFLKPHFRAGEPVIVLVAKGICSILPYEFQDREGRYYMLYWDAKLEGHVMRIPWHLWMEEDGKWADAMMNQHRFPFSLVVLVQWKPAEVMKAVNDERKTVEGADLCRDEYYKMVVKLLEAGAMRVKTMAVALKVEEAELRVWLADEASPADVNGAGWVRMKPLNF